MATYINYVNEEDARVQGAEWLRSIIAQVEGPEAEATFLEKFKASYDEENNTTDDNGILDLFLDYSEALFAFSLESRQEERVKEVESFFALEFYLLTQLDEISFMNDVTKRLCEIFSKNTQSQPELRLRLLMMLYNTYNVSTAEQRPWIFKYILAYAAKAMLFDQVIPYLENLETWMADWEQHLSIDDKRSLYSDISEYMRNLKKRSEAFHYLKRYHHLFQGESKDSLKEAKVENMTIMLLKDAINLPSVIQYDDLLSLDTVKALKANKKHADLVGLCGIFLSGTVNDLRDFHAKKKTLFEEHKLCYDDALSKIRLLTLATLAHGRSEMSLGEVAQALEENEDSVEPWVVRAISEGVIDGRIDQMNQKVLVKSTFQRKFEKEEWAFLDTKLTQWIDNLESVIKFISDQKSMKDTLAAAAA